MPKCKADYICIISDLHHRDFKSVSLSKNVEILICKVLGDTFFYLAILGIITAFFKINAFLILDSQIYVFKSDPLSEIQFSLSRVCWTHSCGHAPTLKRLDFVHIYTRYHATHFIHITSFNCCSNSMR